jgi:hypothetical protein
VRAPARRGRRCSALTALLLAAAAISAACDDIPTNPQQVFALIVDSTPAPSVVAGDTLRDTNGVVTPLTGQAYNVSNQLLANAPVQFLSLSLDQLTITSANIAIGAPTGDSVARVIAQSQSLQSLPFTLPVVLRPDSILYQLDSDSVADSVATMQLSLTNGDSNVSPGLGITLWHNPDSLGGDSVTRTYIVHYQITYPANAAKGTGTPTDTLLFAYLTDPNGNPARTDTTDANGDGTRSVTINTDSVPEIKPGTTDSIVVVATALYRKTPVGNSPLRFVVYYTAPSFSGSSGVIRPRVVIRPPVLPRCAARRCYERR